MVKRVLIVDDNREMLLSLKDGLARYSDSFSIVIGLNGVEALKILKEEAIALVVTDLKMPRMDGFALLTHIMEHYPDIAVIMMTAYSTPEMKNMAKHGGAVGYIEKPFMIEDLAKKMVASLGKTAEGGTLHSVSSGIFLQFIEMEERTCTIRLSDRDSGRQGVLFFRKGELIGARTEELNGEKAAYEIFSWDKTSLSIQNDCLQKNRTIHNDLQAIFLDALLLKDEKDDEKRITDKTAVAAAPEPVRAEKPLKKRVAADVQRPAVKRTAKQAPKRPRVEMIRQNTIPAAVQRASEEMNLLAGLGKQMVEKTPGMPGMGAAKNLQGAAVIQGSLRNLQPETVPSEDPPGTAMPEQTVFNGSRRNLNIEEDVEPYELTFENGLTDAMAIEAFSESARGGAAPRPNQLNQAERIRQKVAREVGPRAGLENVYPDAAWDGLVVEFEKIGAVFNAGRLKAGHVDKGSAHDFILIPGRETIIATVSPKCNRDALMQVLSDE